MSPPWVQFQKRFRDKYTLKDNQKQSRTDLVFIEGGMGSSDIHSCTSVAVAVAAVSAVTVEGEVVVTNIRSHMHLEEAEEVPVGMWYSALMASSFEIAEQEQEAQRQKRQQLAMRGWRCFESAEKELHHIAVVDMDSVVS
jgi:hypothetical protein